MTTFNTLRNGSVALIALVLLALPVSFVKADGEDNIGVWDAPMDSGYNYYPDTYTNYYPDTETNYYPDTETNYYPDSYEESGGYGDYGSSGSTGGGFSMPSFGGSAANTAFRYAMGYQTPAQSNTTVNTNTCVNNSCNQSYVDNSIVDNSVKVSNSFNNQKKQEERYQDCYGQSGNSYNQGYGYNQQDYGYNEYDYNYGQDYNQGYNYNDCYVAPIAYNTTPYITLSQAPYTGLDLGPMGEVLYWTFLVLWCLGAAYLVVVKRVQNKAVAYLNGFLFGTASGSVAAHTTHAPKTHSVAASAPLVEEGIDPFIASQIAKRSK
ncbi:MAG: hypothetical protein JWL87_736 [Candidatus Adlerbacteria bacterium]|nr:hypothetical protein [Candidatus Adlerbacteria bacterium]